MGSFLTRRDAASSGVGALVLVAILIGGGLTYQALVGGSSQQLVTAMLIDAIIVVGLQV